MKWLIHTLSLFLFLFLFTAPTTSAQTADIPSLTGTGVERFIAGWFTSDGATIPAQTTQYHSSFGDSAPRTTETDVLAHATFYYNVTNFRVVSNTAACGALGAGESFNFTLRVNQVNTALTGTCTSASTADSFTLDTDIVAIAPGDRISISVSSTAALLGRALRAGVTFEGYKTITITTTAVPDMTNEILDAITTFAPLIGLVLIIAWAEITKDFVLYLLSILLDIFVIATLPSGLSDTLLIILIAIAAVLALRSYIVYTTPGDNTT